MSPGELEVFDDTAGVQMDPRRVARNQATLRTLNEAIDHDRADGVIAFRCECGQLGRNRLISLRRAQYEAVRLNARRFVIAPGHVVAELEHVVERHTEHAVVETYPHASDFAERTDPARPRLRRSEADAASAAAALLSRSDTRPAPQSIPCAVSAGCLVALVAPSAYYTLRPGSWPQGQPRSSPYS